MPRTESPGALPYLDKDDLHLYCGLVLGGWRFVEQKTQPYGGMYEWVIYNPKGEKVTETWTLRNAILRAAREASGEYIPD